MYKHRTTTSLQRRKRVNILCHRESPNYIYDSATPETALITTPNNSSCQCWSVWELNSINQSFSADGNTLLDEITKINCIFAASTTFRVILTDTVVTNIMYYLVRCKIAQFVERSIGIGMSRPKISKKTSRQGTHPKLYALWKWHLTSHYFHFAVSEPTTTQAWIIKSTFPIVLYMFLHFCLVLCFKSNSYWPPAYHGLRRRMKRLIWISLGARAMFYVL